MIHVSAADEAHRATARGGVAAPPPGANNHNTDPPGRRSLGSPLLKFVRDLTQTKSTVAY